MGKNIFVALLLVMASFQSFAQRADLTFGSWIRKDQISTYIDTSTWHACPIKAGAIGGGCGTIAMTTGANTCVSRGIRAGVDFEPKAYIPGLKISGGANQTWTTCNIRSETVSCSPSLGYKGRSAIIFSQRFAALEAKTGSRYINGPDARGYVCRMNIAGRSFARVCDFVNPFYVNGYWPEYRQSTCEYQRL